jgi:hypothetical protein
MLLGILGIVATIIIGLLPLFISLKDRTIRYWQVETESVFSRKIKEIDELKVLYQEKEIDDDMVILKTVVENNGRKDIDKQIVYEPMTIEFKDPIELLEVEVLQAPNGVLATKNNNSVICNWDLLKRKEFIVLKLLLKNKKMRFN